MTQASEPTPPDLANRGFVISNPDRELVTLLARRAALSLEIKGLRRSRRSVSAICREAYGLPRAMTKPQILEYLNTRIILRKAELRHPQ